jgi:hypothetical protein
MANSGGRSFRRGNDRLVTIFQVAEAADVSAVTV